MQEKLSPLLVIWAMRDFCLKCEFLGIVTNAEKIRCSGELYVRVGKGTGNQVAVLDVASVCAKHTFLARMVHGCLLVHLSENSFYFSDVLF